MCFFYLKFGKTVTLCFINNLYILFFFCRCVWFLYAIFQLFLAHSAHVIVPWVHRSKYNLNHKKIYTFMYICRNLREHRAHIDYYDWRDTSRRKLSYWNETAHTHTDAFNKHLKQQQQFVYSHTIAYLFYTNVIKRLCRFYWLDESKLLIQMNFAANCMKIRQKIRSLPHIWKFQIGMERERERQTNRRNRYFHRRRGTEFYWGYCLLWFKLQMDSIFLLHQSFFFHLKNLFLKKCVYSDGFKSKIFSQVVPEVSCSEEQKWNYR